MGSFSEERDEWENYVRSQLQVGDVVDDENELNLLVNPGEGDVGYRYEEGESVLCGRVVFKKVTYLSGWGWLTEQEYFKLRQSEPRMGP